MKLYLKIAGIVSLVLFASIFFINSSAQATSGACSGHGGVDCSAGADYDGSVVCNDGWRNSSVSYGSMIMCSGYNSYYSAPAIPSCPLYSTYDSLSGSCKCMYGYISSGGSCVSRDQVCRNQLGYNSSYDILSDNCKCDYGYVIDGGSCTYGNLVCHRKFGYNSSYTSYSNKCECDYGYQIDSSGQCSRKETPVYTPPVYVPTCPLNATPINGSCTCNNGYVTSPDKSSCIKPIITSPVTNITAQPSVTLYNFTKDLKSGSKGADVEILQTFLINKSLLKVPKGTKLGTFGASTKAALIKYQKSLNIRQTGVLDQATREKINQEQ